jgi:uncharacterized protein YbaA (DUF1428 family)
MAYVDGFVIPVPKANIDKYRQVAAQAGAIWKEYGALEYRECIGDDIGGSHGMPPFGTAVNATADETVVFSWITYRSRAHRDEVTAKVMADQRINMDDMPFDASRMLYGGFEVLLDVMDPTMETPAAAGAD